MKATFTSVFEAVAKKECSLYSVLDKVAAGLTKNVEFGSVYAALIGKSQNDAQRKIFKDALVLNLPHVTYNGKHGKTVAVDWVEMKEDVQYNLAIKSYRYSAESEIVKPAQCVGHIVEEIEVAQTEVITYASGFTKEVPSLDEEGKAIKVSKKVNLVPREKGIWGFTKDVKEAIERTLDQF